MTNDNLADLKARASRVWDDNSQKDHAELTEERGPGGVSIWRLGEGVVIQETIRDDAPERIKARIRWRVLTDLTGTCPNCATPVGATIIMHENWCPVGYTTPQKYLVNPRATYLIHQLKGRLS